MRMWSVELENNEYADDTFNGTYEECLNYCEEYEYTVGTDCRLAEVEIDENGCVAYTYDVVNEL